MLDLTPILDFASQLPHPSDIGLVKPLGGFQIAPAIFGIIAIFQVTQFLYYGLADNEPKDGFGL